MNVRKIYIVTSTLWSVSLYLHLTGVSDAFHPGATRHCHARFSMRQKSMRPSSSISRSHVGQSSQSYLNLVGDSGSSTVSSHEIKATELQQRLQIQTLSRITIPSVFCAAVCYTSFPSVVMSLATAIHDAFDGANTGKGYETLNLILTDNSNQFIQNVHNALALIFSFLTGNTLFFMYRQQETLYYALFEEISTLTSLLEQSALLSEGREMYCILLESISRYIEEDLKLVTDYKTIHGDSSDFKFSFMFDDMELAREDLPSLILSRRPNNDPLETILYITSVGEPSAIYTTVKELRKARAKRLGALQRKMPEVNMYLLYTLVLTVWISFPVVASGSQTVGGAALLDVFKTQMSLGIFGMVGLLGIINELKRPEVASVYNIDYSLLGKLMRGIEEDLDTRLERAREWTKAAGAEQQDVTEKTSKPKRMRSLIQKLLRKKQRS